MCICLLFALRRKEILPDSLKVINKKQTDFLTAHQCCHLSNKEPILGITGSGARNVAEEVNQWDELLPRRMHPWPMGAWQRPDLGILQVECLSSLCPLPPDN